LGANRRGLNAPRRSAAFGRAILALGLAGLAALGLVFEILFVVKLLLSRSEREIRSAVDAFECPILKFSHGTILGTKKAERLPFAPPVEGLFDFPATLLPVTFPGKSGLDPFFLSWLQIERMPFDLFDDVFLLHFPLEATEGIL
jgi:hypothetical protein